MHVDRYGNKIILFTKTRIRIQRHDGGSKYMHGCPLEEELKLLNVAAERITGANE